MEENNFDRISLSDSELSMVDERQWASVPTAEIPIDTSLEYSPATEPMSLNSPIENYLPQEVSHSIQNVIEEAPITLPIEYLAAVQEMLILIVMSRERTPNEITVFAYPEDKIMAPLPNLLSTSAIEPTVELGSDIKLEDWMFRPISDTPPLLNPSLLVTTTDQTISTITRPIESGTDIVFNDIDQIINHSHRRVNGHRITNMLCVMANGEQCWVSASHLRRDLRVSSLVNRYYRNLKHPYWAQRTSKKRKL